MKLSTSTNIHQVLRGDNYHFDVCDSLARCFRAGYRAVDVSLNSVSADGKPMAGPDWMSWVASVRAALARHGLVATQAHAFYYGNWSEKTEAERAAQEDKVRRAVEAASLLGIPWIVVHPIHGKGAPGLSREEVRRLNVAYFRPYAELGSRLGIGIAVENMFSGHFHTAEELLELVDALESPVFGICWDTGHAHLTGQDQPAAILRMGRTLKATHIADNRGKYDEHMLPYWGDIEWKPIVQALRQSGYEGDFTYEIQNVTRNTPLSMRDPIIRYTWEIGQELLEG